MIKIPVGESKVGQLNYDFPILPNEWEWVISYRSKSSDTGMVFFECEDYQGKINQSIHSEDEWTVDIHTKMEKLDNGEVESNDFYGESFETIEEAIEKTPEVIKNFN